MTSKTATKNLYVSVVRLLTGLVDLVTKTVQLGVAVVTWGLMAVERKTASRAQPKAPWAIPATIRPTVIEKAPVQVSAGSSHEETLYNALVGLGFRVPEVRRFVASVGPRAAEVPMVQLIQEGLRALAS
jgi:hypothetical protein